MTEPNTYQLFIVGGGINGCGIARDAAGRGLSVCLAEQSDLAGATSSGSTKLIHGGLRYLEHYEFALVRKSLTERETLWKIAPHLIRPLRFVLPHHKGLRPAWLIRLGLALYDHLGGRKQLPTSTTLNLNRDDAGKPLQEQYKKGFEYSDCWVDDARLVVLNALDAARHGANILTRTKVISAKRENDKWKIQTQNSQNEIQTFYADVLINAAGPWVDHFLNTATDDQAPDQIRLVRGSHIVVPRRFDHDRCYLFQNADNRIVFAIPYEDQFTLIGTTDSDYDGNPDQVTITDEEIDYLCQAVGEYFVEPVLPDEVVWSYSALRPLLDSGESDAQFVTRDYQIKTQTHQDKMALINIYGGKITTYRLLAEDVMNAAAPYLPNESSSWTASQPLPGGEFATDQFPAQVGALVERYPFLTTEHAHRFTRLYGTLVDEILKGKTSYEDMGLHFGGDLYEAEVNYLINNEWATNAQDVLWRRTKEGLKFSVKQREKLEQFFQTLTP